MSTHDTPVIRRITMPQSRADPRLGAGDRRVDDRHDTAGPAPRLQPPLQVRARESQVPAVASTPLRIEL